jgi:hypothetical protein
MNETFSAAIEPRTIGILNMRYRSVIIVAVVVLFVLLLAARFRDSLQDRPKANPGSSTVAASETGTAGESSGGEPRPVPALPVRNGSAGSDGTPGPPVPIATPAPADGSASRLPPLPAADVPIQEWEERIDTILAGNIDEGIKVDRLLQLFPTLPEDGQIEAAEHLSNLLPDELYPELGQTLTNATASEEVLDVLMTDVLNRPNGIKLLTKITGLIGQPGEKPSWLGWPRIRMSKVGTSRCPALRDPRLHGCIVQSNFPCTGRTNAVFE